MSVEVRAYRGNRGEEVSVMHRPPLKLKFLPEDVFVDSDGHERPDGRTPRDRYLLTKSEILHEKLRSSLHPKAHAAWHQILFERSTFGQVWRTLHMQEQSVRHVLTV